MRLIIEIDEDEARRHLRCERGEAGLDAVIAHMSEQGSISLDSRTHRVPCRVIGESLAGQEINERVLAADCEWCGALPGRRCWENAGYTEAERLESELPWPRSTQEVPHTVRFQRWHALRREALGIPAGQDGAQCPAPGGAESLPPPPDGRDAMVSAASAVFGSRPPRSLPVLPGGRGLTGFDYLLLGLSAGRQPEIIDCYRRREDALHATGPGRHDNYEYTAVAAVIGLYQTARPVARTLGEQPADGAS
jgi:hypothetical protein